MDAEPLTYEKVLHLIQMQGVELAKLRQQFAEERAAREAEDAKRRKKEAKRREELVKQFAERDAADKARWDKDQRRMKHINELYGGVSKTLGQQSEQFFQKALKNANFSFGGVVYNRMTPRLKGIFGQLQDEYDIVLHNGAYLAIIEVKHRFRLSDLHVLLDRKLPNFYTLYPEYSDGKTIYLGIAGFSFDDGVVEEAISRGIGILSKDGKHVRFDDAHLKAY
jgi:hypothetical protein